jgi:hypothetical protein
MSSGGDCEAKCCEPCSTLTVGNTGPDKIRDVRIE